MSEETDYVSRLADEAALRSHLESHLGSVESFGIERHGGGHSNETLFVTWDDRDLVLRRPPPGETAESAHDVLREYTVLEALEDTPVPTPDVVHSCGDHSVIGSDFYVMERLDGHVLREEEPDRFRTPTARQRIGEELVDALAEIHTVDYEAVGLADLGHPAGYLERQVDRWWKQYEWAFERTAEVREIPEVQTVGEWLEANVPEPPEHTLVHGDYKLDNVMFGPRTTPELVGVFDWEMSTLGDPLADVGWLLHYWRDPDDPDPHEADAAPAYTGEEGYPTRAELVDRYERRTGFEFENPRFYRTLTAFKMGGIGEMFFRRYLEGNSDDDRYPLMEAHVPRRVERAEAFIEADGDLF